MVSKEAQHLVEKYLFDDINVASFRKCTCYKVATVEDVQLKDGKPLKILPIYSIFVASFYHKFKKQ